jgi:hypothetical protein
MAGFKDFKQIHVTVNENLKYDYYICYLHNHN